MSTTPGTYTPLLHTMVADLLAEADAKAVWEIAKAWPASYKALIQLDRSLGGPGFSNVIGGEKVRYDIDDRDIFRPFYYFSMYFKMSADGSHAPWLARSLVQMGGFQLESLIKRITGEERLPLGAALGKSLAKRKIEADVWELLQRFSNIYNAAKHRMNQPNNTHLFSMADAILAYFVTRKLAIVLYPLATIKTDITIFD